MSAPCSLTRIIPDTTTLGLDILEQAIQGTCFHTDIRKKFLILQEFRKIIRFVGLAISKWPEPAQNEQLDTSGHKYAEISVRNKDAVGLSRNPPQQISATRFVCSWMKALNVLLLLCLVFFEIRSSML
jgi:hypothetical protein